MFFKPNKIKQIKKIKKKIVYYELKRDLFKSYINRINNWIKCEKRILKQLEKQLSPEDKILVELK